jgi:hypothetical protein
MTEKMNPNLQPKPALQQVITDVKLTVQFHGRWVSQVFSFLQFSILIFLWIFAERSLANESDNLVNHRFSIYKKSNALYANHALQKFIESGILDCSLRLERKGNKSLLVTSQGHYEMPDSVRTKFIDDTVAVVSLNILYRNMLSSQFLIPLNEFNQPLKGTRNDLRGSGYEYQLKFNISSVKIIQNLKKIYPDLTFHKTSPEGPDDKSSAFASGGIDFPRFSMVLSKEPARNVQFSHFCKFLIDYQSVKPTHQISTKSSSSLSTLTGEDKAKLISALAEFADLNSAELPIEKFERHFNAKGVWTIDQATGLPAIYKGSATAYGLEARGGNAINTRILAQDFNIQFPRTGYCLLLADLLPAVPQLKRHWHLGPAVIREDVPNQWEFHQTYNVENAPGYTSFRFVLDINNRVISEDQRCLREIGTSHYLR